MIPCCMTFKCHLQMHKMPSRMLYLCLYLFHISLPTAVEVTHVEGMVAGFSQVRQAKEYKSCLTDLINLEFFPPAASACDRCFRNESGYVGNNWPPGAPVPARVRCTDFCHPRRGDSQDLPWEYGATNRGRERAVLVLAFKS